MALTYHRKGDYLFPNLTIQETEAQIGKYGMLRRTFLKEYKNSLYQSLLLTGEIEQPSGGDRESGTGKIGSTDGETVGEESGTVERGEPDGVDSTYEQSDGNSGREHLDGIGIQLIEDTSEDQLSKAEEEIASALSLPELPSVNEQKREIENRVAALYAGEIAIPSEVVDEF